LFEGWTPVPKSAVTLKHKKGDVTASVSFTDGTAKAPSSFKDVAATLEWKYNKEWTLSGSLDLANRQHKVCYGLDLTMGH
jgi:hypothetical protein